MLKKQACHVMCSTLFFVLNILYASATSRFLDPASNGLFHTVFPVECRDYYLLWQSIGVWYSFRKIKQPGSFTRLLACPEKERALFEKSGALDVCPTHVAPSYTEYHPGDFYGPYNMAGTILHWVTNAKPAEDYVLILDSDMLLMRPILPAELGLRPGHAHAAYYGYLKGVINDLATRQVPEIVPRNDSKAGPPGRRADQVGGVQAMTLSDLRRVAPLWLMYTERVREDPLAWRDTGDVYVSKGGKPWISEMYGYTFGCAKAGVWHTANYTLMIYPEYLPAGIPSVLHYGLVYSIGDYRFDKHWFYTFDPMRCPPWDSMLDDMGRPRAGILPTPPGPEQLPSGRGFKRLRYLYASYTPALLNEAFCELHLSRCQHTEELISLCRNVTSLAEALITEIRQEEDEITRYGVPCYDEDERCPGWADQGECRKNPGFMVRECRKSCLVCHSHGPPLRAEAPAGSGREHRTRTPVTAPKGRAPRNLKPRAAKIFKRAVGTVKDDLATLALSDRDREEIQEKEKDAQMGETAMLAFLLPLTWALAIGGLALYVRRQVHRPGRRRRLPL